MSPNTDRQRASREAQRATALLAVDRFDEALAGARASNEADPHGAGEELISFVTIMEARNTMPSRGHDDRPLLEAIDYHVALRRTILSAGRAAIAGIAAVRAALGTAVLGDRLATSEAIDEMMGAEGALENDGARQLLLDAALIV